MSKKRRINLRQTPRVSYYEPEEPNLDEYVFCSECGDYVYEYCSIHGPLLVIPDDKVPINPDVPSFIPRAALTIPHVFLHLNYSSIPGAGLGVFTTLTLPRGVRFGPYRGRRSDHITSSYCWQIRDANNRPCHVVDACEPAGSNWMRYVNCSRHWCEQNLVAYQYRGQIYYRTIKMIPRFTELMVFYGSEFACELGIDLKRYNSPSTYAQKLGTQKTNDETKKTTQIETTKEDCSEIHTRLGKNDPTTLTKADRNHSISVELSNPVEKMNTLAVQRSEKVEDLNNNISSNIYSVSSVNPVSTENKLCKSITKTNKDFNRTIITKYSCDICSYVAHNKTSIENHMILHKNVNGIKFFKCKYCLHVSKTERMKKHHELTHVDEKPYSCDVRQRQFSENGTLATYKRTHTGEKQYSCDVCQRQFSESGHLATHKRTHTGEKPYSCDVCQLKFSQRGTLATHKRTHTGEKPYSCDVCQLKFSQRGTLAKHKRTHTGEKPYSCDVCQLKFSQRGTLATHKRTHTGEKPYSCDVCQLKFSRRGSLATHKRTHTGEKPYSCDVCQLKFSQRGSLATHKRTHTGEKPYSCDVCQLKFSQGGSLATHKRTHTGEKPYSCDVCQLKFSRRGSLATHKRTHSGEKPYSCDVCQLKFSQRGNLAKHKRTHTNEKPYSCDVCQCKFSYRQTLRKHKNTCM